MADRDDAIAFLRAVMDDDSASMANRIKAAEAILRGNAPKAPGDGQVALHTMSEAELLAAARGEGWEGGGPPREGPVAGGLSRVPSLPHAEHSEPAPHSQGSSPQAHPLAGPDHKAPATPHPFLKRGPKEDPSLEEDPFRNLAPNRKRSEEEMANPISLHLASEQQIGDDPAPWE